MNSTLQQSAEQTTIPQFEPEQDAFRVAAERRKWWTFLDSFLLPIVKKEMVTNNPAVKDAPMLSMMAADAARALRSTASFSEVGSRVDLQQLSELKFRNPKAYSLVQLAVKLSNDGKSQSEILEALATEAEK